MKDTQEIFDTSTPTLPTEAGVAAQPGPTKLDQEKQVRQGYGMMVIAAAMAGGDQPTKRTKRVVNVARMFCILFAFVAPNLLMLRVAF